MLGTTAVIFAATLVADRGQITLGTILAWSNVTALFGYYLLGTSIGGADLFTEIVVTTVTQLSYVVARVLSPAPWPPFTGYKRNHAQEYSAATLLLSLVMLFVGYNFLVGGAPLLSANTEVARLNITSAGLFGLPSRMFLIGLPFSTIYVTSMYSKMPSKKHRRIYYLVWIIYVLAQLLDGFKSALLQVLGAYVVAQFVAARPVHARSLLRTRVLVSLIGTVAVAVFYTFQYHSLQVTSVSQAFSYLLTRLTLGSAIPGAYVLDHLALLRTGYPHVLTDARYFMWEYFHIGGDPGMPLDKLVSSLIYHTPLSATAVVVPVTIGGFAELFVDSPPIAWLAVVLIGPALVFTGNMARKSGTVFATAAWGLIASDIVVFAAQGELAYVAINLFVVFVFLKVVEWIAQRIIVPAAATLQAPEPPDSRALSAARTWPHQ